MSDIVERLRTTVAPLREAFPNGPILLLMDEAADEIERLRAEKAQIVEWLAGTAGTIPALAVFALSVSGNNQPCMSGDPRDRLSAHQRRRFDNLIEHIAHAIESGEHLARWRVAGAADSKR